MPGVTITQVSPTNNNSFGKNVADQFFTVGLAERGPVNTPVAVRSIGEFENVFGGYIADSYAYDTLKTYFAEGGRLANFVRVVGQTVTNGEVVLSGVNSNDEIVSLLTIATNSPGKYSRDYQIKIEPSPLAVNQVKPEIVTVTLLHQGTAIAFARNVKTCQELAQKLNLADGVIKVTLFPAATTENILPSPITAVLSEGDDDVEHVTPQDFYSALNQFAPQLGTGAVAIPDLAGVETAWQVLVDHATTNRRVALLSLDQGFNYPRSLTSLTAVTALKSDAAGVFTPWVTVRSQGSTRSIPPEGYVAGVRARAIQQAGVWRVPAGKVAESVAVVDLETAYQREDIDALDDAGISVIRKVVGNPRLYGYRALSDDENYHFLTARDFLNKLAFDAESLLEDFVFETIDGGGKLLTKLENVLLGYLVPIANAGGLYPLFDDQGHQIDPGYVVDCGPSVNTPASLARNVLNAKVGVRIAPTAALVNLTITKVPAQQQF